MKFKFYVLNYNINRNQVEMFNIFSNYLLNDYAVKEVKKYLRLKKKYKTTLDESLSGFEAFKREITSLILWQEWSRREYEIGVCDAFNKDVNKIEKWDCYDQCIPNIETICHDIIRQYKEVFKKQKENDNGETNKKD